MDLPTSLLAKSQSRRFHGPPPPPIEFPKWIKISGKDELALTAEHEWELMEAEEAQERKLLEIEQRNAECRVAAEREAAEAVAREAGAAATSEIAGAETPGVENLLSAPEKRGPGRPRIVRSAED